jgi:NADPH:quinone reductase-like Zn-dependent oxidoreductase
MPTDTQHSHSNEQQQMDAVVIQASGPPAQSLAYRSEPVPQPGPGEVLVEVHAAAVNPLDVANALGLLGTSLPMIPGADFAAIVISAGDHTGQEVWGSAPALGMTLPGMHAGMAGGRQGLGPIGPQGWIGGQVTPVRN